MLKVAMSDVTQIMQQIESGDPAAARELLPVVYGELRRLAAVRMAQEAPGMTLQPTALVHEAYLRLVGGEQPRQWDGRGHFFAAAAEAMRRILVEEARAKQTLKRGGDRLQHSLLEGDVSALPINDELLDLNDALDRLEQVDAEAAEVVKLRVFAGMTVEEAAADLEVSPRTVKRNWAWARAWLARSMHDDTEE